MRIETGGAHRSLKRLRAELEALIEELHGSAPTVTSDMLGEGFASQAGIIVQQLHAIHEENIRRAEAFLEAVTRADEQVTQFERQDEEHGEVLPGVDGGGEA